VRSRRRGPARAARGPGALRLSTSDPARPADRVIRGRIATLAGSSGFAWTEAIAIRGDRVVATGTWREVQALIGRATLVWRLRDDLAVVPGITDAHLHLAAAAVAASQLDVSGAAGRVDTLALVRAAHEAMAADEVRAGEVGGGWLLGHGWSMDRMASWPTASDLEAVAPGRRVALWAHDHHARWVSVAALAAAAIHGSDAPPRGGEIRRGSNGDATGILHENAATLVDRAIPAPTAGQLEAAIVAYAPTLLALGVTGAHDPGQLVDDENSAAGPWLYREMALAGRLPLRVVASIRERQIGRAGAWGMRSGRAAGRYRDGWLKLFADGSLGSRSAALLEPYEADDRGGPPVGGPRGMPLRTQSELDELARAAMADGIAVQIHAIGDGAVRIALDVLAGLPPAPGGVRHRIEHAQLVAAEDVARFAALDIAASVQPCHLCSDAVAARSAWGTRTSQAFPLAALDAAGVLIPFGTDAPVEPPDPWRGLAAAVSRRDIAWPREREPFHPEQALPVWRALRAACVDPAISIGAMDEGRLLPGSRADLLVIPAEGFLSDGPAGAAALAVTRPLATLLDGQPHGGEPDFAFSRAASSGSTG
jgi:predicted amidohydrolase YtcJ